MANDSAVVLPNKLSAEEVDAHRRMAEAVAVKAPRRRGRPRPKAAPFTLTEVVHLCPCGAEVLDARLDVRPNGELVAAYGRLTPAGPNGADEDDVWLMACPHVEGCSASAKGYRREVRGDRIREAMQAKLDAGDVRIVQRKAGANHSFGVREVVLVLGVDV